MMGTRTATICREEEAGSPALDEKCVREAYRQLADCIERIGDLDRSKESRPVRQMLAFLWAAQDTLDDLTKPRRKP